MTHVHLRGRDGQLAVLRASVEAVLHGASASVLIEGAPGTGKTELLSWSGNLARGRGVRVLWVRADEFDRYAPLAALDAAVHGAGSRGPVPETDDQRLWLLDGIANTLQTQARRAPVAVLVDDAQWADPATLFALRTLPDRLSDAPILWVVAARPGSGRGEVARLVDALHDADAKVITLAPLTAAALRQIAADALGAPPTAALLHLLHGSAGNPFLATELLRSLRDADAITVQDGMATPVSRQIPAGFRRSVEARLDRLPGDAVRLLQVGSVLGREFDLVTVARILGKPVGALLSAVDSARTAELLTPVGRRFAFRHDLIRQAVHDDLSLPVRSALHQEAVGILRDAGAHQAEVVWHMMLAGGSLDDRSLGTLRSAVRELARTAPAAAADLAREAAALLPSSDSRRVELLTEAAELLGWTRRVHEAIELVEATIADGLEPAQEAALRLVGGEVHQAAGDDAAAMRHLQRALDMPGLPDDLYVRLLKAKATGHIYRGEIEAAEATDTGLVEAAHRSDDPAIVVSALVFRSQTAFYRGHLSQALGLAEDATRRTASMSTSTDGLRLRPPRIPALWLSIVLTSGDRLEDAEQVLREGRRHAEERGPGWSLPYWHACRSVVLLERGALDDAAAEAEACLSVAGELEIIRALPLAHAVLACIETARGDLARARAHVRAAPADAPGATSYATWTALARARLFEAEGRTAEAAGALAAVPQGDRTAWLLSVPPGQWPFIARTALQGGDRTTAEAVAAVVRSLTDSGPGIVHAVRHHIDGLLHDEGADLLTAVNAYREGPRQAVFAAACEDLGAHLIAHGQGDSAVAPLEEAARLLSAVGAAHDHERIRHRLRDVGVRAFPVARRTADTTGWDALTDSELKVVHLVADGLTNRAVADRLYLSVHTVNTHLKHVFTKLGINTRVELTRLVMEHDGSDRP
ncbi:ATP-binding protein [Streptomyces sp. NPDC002574]|uniref:ATP-binding protein n=1 Tax=Streptomyces sp. NPDC002574 TaxID=3364652 RepID=UPI003685802B